MQQRLFSAAKPTGELHLGNYLGALKNWVALQSQYECIYAIADYHALTVEIDPKELEQNTINLACDLLALGIDPKKSIFFRQSDVPEHTELSWIFACLTPVSELTRMTQYKDLVQEKKGNANAGLLTYPVLQAADILLYRATHVPVGEDQLQHLELSRIIARKFNNRYGDFFPEVNPVLSETVRVMSLDNPEGKMSKSHGAKSYIALRDKPDVITQKIGKAVTDSNHNETSLSGGHNLLTLFKYFGSAERYQYFEQAFKLKKISYAELKKELTEALISFLEPVQKRQAYYDAHHDEVRTILREGAVRARGIAQENSALIRKRIGLGPRS
ncbi:MAG: tryptophan--tRNA ligase [Candidatus Komeilibacteria bacterium RIFCSPLOWO2_01_FULL_52_15]|uniref:Tryptophan--tRNA ligase n=2 Tax=Candidatus Komeiliibacteriota TaxID=1817908 RepID=A0A1G2BRS5_9BACT|nr:MAG: tryptophan--tRNA ligase [Candidatus Komeilibacteria bacterium RIFCSPHIGHO2_01_FULL_52_14]OGY91732.1 MAG: tryptophan--tRNA ligase [Candidatus Komeilibacteria bacterium RIFCSPLOWO2_01_FULL_52_15]